MSIISSEIEAQKQRDPSYIDSDLQWAWGRGYKAGTSREITEEEIAAAMPKPESSSRSPARGWRTSSESRSTRQEERQWRSEQATRP